MAKIYFICGFIGSGKTTYAKKLAKQQPAFRFTIDEWMIPLYGEHMEREVFDARFDTLTALFKASAEELLGLGTSVIFDFGLWGEAERRAMSCWAKSINVEYEMIYLDVSYQACCERAYSRNLKRGDQAYEMTPEMMAMFWDKFEKPSANEKITWLEL
ncbi:ATP-binding protein [Agarivorans sp. TSD2052]|uniref:AAA family ATPase n=1 Tax=Agarivorans sp. TSD2052 TaxID=2937286 RepID=UPI00200E2BCA|nr:ATP-binding protein [Agarivorans sp. TSD2052]UPW20390.1 ATP-binding protein [Agarivorans sp. TSD2052]